MSMTIEAPTIQPKLDPKFVPASLWNRQYLERAAVCKESRRVRIGVTRPNGTCWVKDSYMLPARPEFQDENFLYLERMVKFLLWAWGGSCIQIAGADETTRRILQAYSPKGTRQFDSEFLGERCFGQALRIETASHASIQAKSLTETGSFNSLSGNRIGFDLGGSDRKCAAVMDGKVVFSEEIKWSPYFEEDPSYHIEGIRNSLSRAAAHLPSIDAIGGSAAGIYIDNEPRIASLFRGVSQDMFEKHVRTIFKDLKAEWNDVPFEVANDGDVTAIAGAMSIQDSAVLGIAMGTSQAVGYIDPEGRITGWLNELAFAPVDYRADAPVDEWSGDCGCGVQYFSQQTVGRLIPASGIAVSQDCGLPERLETVQERMQAGDERAAAIYETIGTYLGYSIAHYAEYYDFKNVMILGRVSSGKGGDIIQAQAREVLEIQFSDISEQIQFHTPDEKMKRHGQAIAAASLPRI